MLLLRITGAIYVNFRVINIQYLAFKSMRCQLHNKYKKWVISFLHKLFLIDQW